jgi:DNA-binding NtrC family response regulator
MLPARTSAIEEAHRQRVILVVDDEIMVRTPVAEFLREAGYKVIEAANAAEAVAVFVAGIAVDLVFSDIRMPGRMDGVGLARWIFEHRPDLPVLLTSSGGPPPSATEAPAPFLPKPFRLAAAALRIAALLDDPPRDG